MIKYNKKTKKDCLSQNRYIYTFDRIIDEEFISFLEEFGKVNVFRNFEIPLITMDVVNSMRLTTLMNSKKLDVFFKKKRDIDFVEIFEDKLNKFL